MIAKTDHSVSGSECGLGHTLGQGGQVEACLDMVEKISKLLATRGISFPIESPQSGQLAMARFSEDGLLYMGQSLLRRWV